MNVIDLKPDHAEIVNRILAEHVPDCEVRAFGSRVTGSAGEYSDLDLAVVGEGPLDLRVISRLNEAFEESSLPMQVDVLDWHSIPGRFEKEINRHYVVVQKGSRSRSWRSVRLGDVAHVNTATYSPREQWPFVNYLDTGNITDNRISRIKHLVSGQDTIPSRARRKAKPGDIVYSTVRPNQRHYGILKDVPDNFLVSTAFAVLKAREGLADTEYLYWYLTQDHIVGYLQLIAEDSTSAYPSIRPADLESLTISLPPLDEQQAIARTLGALEEKTQLNQRMSETLEEMARALFKSWFVDFDPVHAKMEGRWKPGQSLPGLPAHLYDLFPDRLVDSYIGPIPENWSVGCLQDMAVECRRLISPAEIGGVSPYITLAHMPRQSITLDKWTRADKAISGKLGFEKGEILYGKLRPYFHKVGVAPVRGVCSTDIVVTQPRSFEWFGFILGHMSSTAFVHYTSARSTGTRMPRTNWKTMAQYELATPPPTLALAFTEYVHPLIDRILNHVHTSRSLADLRDTLLPMLVSGIVRVPYPQGYGEPRIGAQKQR